MFSPQTSQVVPEVDVSDLEAGKPATNADKSFVRQLTNDPNAWNIDGRNGNYHNISSLRLVVWAQMIYMVSLTIIIPTAGDYTSSLGHGSAVYFGLVVGISSVVDPLFSRIMSRMLKGASLKNIFLINATINLVSCLAYALAKHAGGAGGAIIITSRVVLGLGSVQTAMLQYFGCAVSNRRVRYTHFLTTAAISYGFAIGIFLAFILSIASYHGVDQNTLPGYFSAALWFLYIPLHCCFFKEPNKYAGIIDSDSSIRLGRQMKPILRREPFGGLVPCVFAIVTVAIVTGAFEVMTIGITQELWKWDVMKSSCYLGGVMLFVALTTFLAYPFTRWLGEGCTLVTSMIFATLMLPFFYIPVSLRYHDKMGSTWGMVIYLLVSIVALSLLNIGRTISFTLMTDLPSPQWRDHFLSTASQIFTMGRGIGPILAGALIADNSTTITVLVSLSACAALAVLVAHSWNMLLHNEHEVGPAQAEQAERTKPSWLRKHSTWSRSWSLEEDDFTLGMTPPHVGMETSQPQKNPMMQVATSTGATTQP